MIRVCFIPSDLAIGPENFILLRIGTLMSENTEIIFSFWDLTLIETIPWWEDIVMLSADISEDLAL